MIEIGDQVEKPGTVAKQIHSRSTFIPRLKSEERVGTSFRPSWFVTFVIGANRQPCAWKRLGSLGCLGLLMKILASLRPVELTVIGLSCLTPEEDSSVCTA